MGTSSGISARASSFNLYVSPVEHILQAHSLKNILYWFATNKLVSNSSETKYVYFTSKSRPKPTSVSISIGCDILEL